MIFFLCSLLALLGCRSFRQVNTPHANLSARIRLHPTLLPSNSNSTPALPILNVSTAP